MQIDVYEGYFTREDEALKELEQLPLHSFSMNVPPVSNTSHWHHFSSRLFVLEGELEITDVARNEVFKAGPGSRVDVPARVLHCENSAGGYRIVAGMTVDPASLKEPLNLDPEDL